MATVRISFNTDNAAFEDNPEECSHVLTQAERWLSDNLRPGESARLFDSNGNTVGLIKVTR